METGNVSPGFTASESLKPGKRGNTAFDLVADVEKHLLGGDGDHRALQLLLACDGGPGVGFLELREQIAERFSGFGGGIECFIGGGVEFLE